jgi:hypothetical protein
MIVALLVVLRLFSFVSPIPSYLTFSRLSVLERERCQKRRLTKQRRAKKARKKKEESLTRERIEQNKLEDDMENSKQDDEQGSVEV